MLLVGQVDSILLLQVTQHIHGSIKMRQCDNLSTNEIVETVSSVENKTISNKATGLHFLRNFLLQFESIFDTWIGEEEEEKSKRKIRRKKKITPQHINQT